MLIRSFLAGLGRENAARRDDDEAGGEGGDHGYASDGGQPGLGASTRDRER
jgi:hypothetical protein